MSIDTKSLYIRYYDTALEEKLATAVPSDYIGLESMDEMIDRIIPFEVSPEQRTAKTAVSLLPEGMALIQKFGCLSDVYKAVLDGDVPISEDKEELGLTSFVIVNHELYRVYSKYTDLLDHVQEKREFERIRKERKLEPISVPVKTVDGPIVLMNQVLMGDMYEDVRKWFTQSYSDRLRYFIKENYDPAKPIILPPPNPEFFDNTWLFGSVGALDVITANDSVMIEFYKLTKGFKDDDA